MNDQVRGCHSDGTIYLIHATPAWRPLICLARAALCLLALTLVIAGPALSDGGDEDEVTQDVDVVICPDLTPNYQKATSAYQQGDYVIALCEWRPLAEQGNADAQFNIGLLYDFGLAAR